MGKKPLSFPLITVLTFRSRVLPWNQAAQLFKMSWHTARSAVDAAVVYGREREDYHHVRFIGIDEVGRSRGQDYHTTVYDLERRRLICSGAHRDKDSLRRFFEWWGEKLTKAIKGVCCDMWQNYIDVVQEYCSEAVIVFDTSPRCNRHGVDDESQGLSPTSTDRIFFAWISGVLGL
jgi:Transposase and inactivated derivatives